MRIFAVVLLSFALAFVASASPVCINNTSALMVADGGAVCSTIPGLGDKLILPDSNFVAEVWWEDLDTRIDGTSPFGLPGDGDFDDAHLRIDGNYSLMQLILSFEGGLASYKNTLSWVGGSVSVDRDSVGPVSGFINWVPGTELVIQDFTSGGHWFTGPGSVNADGNLHAILQIEISPTT